MHRLVVLLLVLRATAASAYPFLSLRPGGSPFEGPTDPEMSSLWWNPAALGLMRGVHVGGTGTLLAEQGSIARSPICLATGLPDATCAGNTMSFPSVPIAGLSGSGLGGVSWDFRTENIVAALGAYAPWESHRNLQGATSPTAYHMQSEDWSTTYLALALAFKLSRDLHFGVSVGLADSFVTLRFDRDSALEARGCAPGTPPAQCQTTKTWPGGSSTVAGTGYENPAYAEHIMVHGDGGGFLPSGFAIALGALYQASDRVVLGLSWSRMFPIFSNTSRYASGSVNGASVTPPSAGTNPCPTTPTSNGVGVCTGAALIQYDVPDVFHLGLRAKLTERLELSSWLRVVVYGGYPDASTAQRGLVIRLAGDPVVKGLSPERILFGMSLQPAVAGEVGLRYRPIAPLRLGASVIVESSAIPSGYVSAEALDAPKLDAMLGIEWKAARLLRLSVGYEVTGYFLPSLGPASPGVFDPSSTVRCVDGRYGSGACQGPLAGTGQPSAAGAYNLVDHRVSLGVMFDL